MFCRFSCLFGEYVKNMLTIGFLDYFSREVRPLNKLMRIEDVKHGDLIDGKEVVEVVHRFDVVVRKYYVRLVCRGGWPVVGGYVGRMVEVQPVGRSRY